MRVKVTREEMIGAIHQVGDFFQEKVFPEYFELEAEPVETWPCKFVQTVKATCNNPECKPVEEKKEEHVFEITDLGLGVCKKCGAHNTTPQFPPYCIKPKSIEKPEQIALVPQRMRWNDMSITDTFNELIKAINQLTN